MPGGARRPNQPDGAGTIRARARCPRRRPLGFPGPGPRGTLIPLGDPGLWGPKDSPGNWKLSPIPRASCVLGNPAPASSTPTPEGLSFLRGARASGPAPLPGPLLLPPLRDFCPTNGVGRCRWTRLERRGNPAASPSPGVTPAGPPQLGGRGASLKPPGQETLTWNILLSLLGGLSLGSHPPLQHLG